jgi:uncharacterized protein
MFKNILFFFLFSQLSLFSIEWGSQPDLVNIVPSKEGTYKILSLDGGGVRGAFTAKVISMLEEELHFLQYVDFFAGTSTGAILAFGLAYGISPEKMVNFYQTKSGEIFKVKKSLSETLQISSKYQNESFKKILTEILPIDLKLSDLKKKVLCISFNLHNPYYNTWTPALIDNFTKSDITVIDAILRSTAAPTYFPSYQGYVDGGVVANNPSMMALARALDKQGGAKDLFSIKILSIGTGITTSYIPQDVNWGTLEWIYNPFLKKAPAYPLLDIIFDGTVSVPHFQCSRILGNSYYRLNPFLSSDIDLDDTEKVDLLIKEAQDLKENPLEWEKLLNWVREEFLPKEK